MAPTLASIVTEFIVEEILYGDGDLEPDEDLFDAIKASTFIPHLTDRGWTKTYRGHSVLDGGRKTTNHPAA